MTSKNVSCLDIHKGHLTKIENEIKQLESMYEKSCKLPEMFEDINKCREELRKDKNDLIERFRQLRIKDRELRKERLNLEAQMNTALPPVDKIPLEELNELYNMLGFHIIESRSLANSEMEWTLQFMGFDYYIKFNTGDTHELIDIQPEHKNFSKIKLFLRQTQDFGGFLHMARKYFIIKGFQQNKENNDVDFGN